MLTQEVSCLPHVSRPPHPEWRITSKQRSWKQITLPQQLLYLSQVISGAYIWQGWLALHWLHDVIMCIFVQFLICVCRQNSLWLTLSFWTFESRLLIKFLVSCIMIFLKKLHLLRFFPSAADLLRTFRISLNLFIEDTEHTLLAYRFSVFLRVITDFHDLLL